MRRMQLDAVIASKARACGGGAELGDDRLDLRRRQAIDGLAPARPGDLQEMNDLRHHLAVGGVMHLPGQVTMAGDEVVRRQPQQSSEEHTSELQSLMRRSYAIFC